MTTYAYLRVSTDQQDIDNQRYGIFGYANTHGLGPLQFVLTPQVPGGFS